jgi:hypothetical protein
MADNLTVGDAPKATDSSSEGAPASREDKAARAKIDEIKQRARSQLNHHLTDERAAAILARREEKVAAEKRVKDSAETFETGRSKETVGNKASERETRAQKATGAEKARGPEGLTEKERQGIRSDPKYGPKLPVAEGRPIGASEAASILTKIFGHIEVGGKRLDLEAYAKTLRPLPPSQPKTASAGAKDSGPRLTASSSAQTAGRSAATGQRRDLPPSGPATSTRPLTMNVRTAQAPGAGQPSNGGGGLVSSQPFDGMHFNWDGFFAVWMLHAREDLFTFRKQMKDLNESQRSVTRTSLEVARELLRLQHSHQTGKAWSDVGEAFTKHAGLIDEMPGNRVFGGGNANDRTVARREARAALEKWVEAKSPTMDDKGLKEAMSVLRAKGGELSAMGVLQELRSRPDLNDAQTKMLDKELNASLFTLEKDLREASSTTGGQRALAGQRAQFLGEHQTLREGLYRPELGKDALGDERLTAMQTDLMTRLQALGEKLSPEGRRQLTPEQIKGFEAEKTAGEQLGRQILGLSMERQKPPPKADDKQNLENHKANIAHQEEGVRQAYVDYKSAQSRAEPGDSTIGDAARQELYTGYREAAASARPKLRQEISDKERDLDSALLVPIVDKLLAKVDRPKPPAPGEARDAVAMALGKSDPTATLADAGALRQGLGERLVAGGTPTMDDPGYRALVDRLRDSGGDSAVVALVQEALRRPDLSDAQRRELEKQRDTAQAAADGRLLEVGDGEIIRRDYGSYRVALANKFSALSETLYRRELRGPFSDERLAELEKKLPGPGAANTEESVMLRAALANVKAARRQLATPGAGDRAAERALVNDAEAHLHTLLLVPGRRELNADPKSDAAEKARLDLFAGYREATPQERIALRARLDRQQREVETLDALRDHAGETVKRFEGAPSDKVSARESYRRAREGVENDAHVPKPEAWLKLSAAERRAQHARAVSYGNAAQNARSELHKPGMVARAVETARIGMKTFSNALEATGYNDAIHQAVSRVEGTARQHAAQTDASMVTHYGRAQGLINQLSQLLAVSRSR